MVLDDSTCSCNTFYFALYDMATATSIFFNAFGITDFTDFKLLKMVAQEIDTSYFEYKANEMFDEYQNGKMVFGQWFWADKKYSVWLYHANIFVADGRIKAITDISVLRELFSNATNAPFCSVWEKRFLELEKENATT